MHTSSKIKRIFTFFAFLFFVTSQAIGSDLSDQRLMLTASYKDLEYRLPLGAIKKVNAVSIVSKEVILRSEVQRNTYEFNRPISLNNAWTIVQDTFPKERRVLFSCDGLDCGSSNAWANYVFGIKQLYGLELSQKLRVFELNDDSRSYLVVYFVQRGNKRIYAQIDRLQTMEEGSRIAASPSAISQAFSEKGYYTLPVLRYSAESIEVEFDEAELDALLLALRAKPVSRFQFVGHSYLSQTSDENREVGMRYAKALFSKFGNQNKGAKRFSVNSAGDLAPNKALPEERVVVVLKN